MSGFVFFLNIIPKLKAIKLAFVNMLAKTSSLSFTKNKEKAKKVINNKDILIEFIKIVIIS